VIKIAFYILVFSSQAIAAGGHGSPFDLLAPAVNVLLLVGFLIWKLRGPVNNFFKSKAEEVKQTLEKAEIRAKEVEKLYREQKEKMDKLPQAITEAEQESVAEVANYKTELETNFKERLEDLNDEAKAKMNAQQSEALSELEELLLNEVIAKTKNQITSDAQLANNVNKNLLEGAN